MLFGIRHCKDGEGALVVDDGGEGGNTASGGESIAKCTCHAETLPQLLCARRLAKVACDTTSLGLLQLVADGIIDLGAPAALQTAPLAILVKTDMLGQSAIPQLWTLTAKYIKVNEMPIL